MDADLTLETIASACSVSLGTARSWERGTSVPRADQLASLAAAVGRSPGWFYELAE